jgi:hypothetical protein
LEEKLKEKLAKINKKILPKTKKLKKKKKGGVIPFAIGMETIAEQENDETMNQS